MSITTLKCLQIRFFVSFFGLKNDKVSRRILKLIISIGLEIIRIISLNLLLHFTKKKFLRGNFVEEGIYYSGSGPKCVLASESFQSEIYKK